MLMLLTNLFCDYSFGKTSYSLRLRWISTLLEMHCDPNVNQELIDRVLEDSGIKLLLSSNKRYVGLGDLGFSKQDTQLHEFFLLLVEKIKNLKQIHLENYQYLYNVSDLFYKKRLENFSQKNKETQLNMAELNNSILNILETNFNFNKNDITVVQDKIFDYNNALTFQLKDHPHKNFHVCIDFKEPLHMAEYNFVFKKITIGSRRIYDFQVLIHELTHHFVFYNQRPVIFNNQRPDIYNEIVSILMENSPITMNTYPSTSLEYRKNSYSQETLYNMLISYYLKYGLTDNESQKEAVLSFFSDYRKDHLTNNLDENILSKLIEFFGMSFLDFEFMRHFLGEAVSHYYYSKNTNLSNITFKDFSPLFSELSFEKILQFLNVELNDFVDWVFNEYFILNFNNCSNIE